MLQLGILFLFSQTIYGQGSISQVYNRTKLGQGYVQSSLLLGQRYDNVGIDYMGLQQPASLIISGIPSGANIEKAFLWWEQYGIDTESSATLENPSGTSTNFDGLLIASDTNFCWGPQQAFRADVTSIIEGNGVYTISGLPTSVEAKDTLEDVDGVTLLIMYSDNTSDEYAEIMIYDGFLKVEGDTMKPTVPVSTDLTVASGKAFMIITDMEYYYDTKISFNGGSYYSPGKDFWDFEQANATFVNGQTSCEFGIKPGVDCAHVLAAGTLVRLPVDSIPAGIEEIELSSFELYPNPTTGIVQIVMNENMTNLSKLLDITGKVLFELVLTDTNTSLDLSDYPAGIYFLQVGTETKRLVITDSN